MKKNLFYLLLAFLPATLLAQETVYPITEVDRDNSFYVEQMKLWKVETEKQPNNPEAWANYYKAARYKDFPAVFNDEEYKKEVQKIVDDMQKAIPNTYTAYYIAAWNTKFGEEKYKLLMKAYAIDPNQPKMLEDLFIYHYRSANWKKAHEFMVKWYDSGAMPPQLLYYCYNLLACVEENGILLLMGDNDSFPTWMLQAGQQVRPDVIALNTSLMLEIDFTREAMKFYNLKVDESAYKYLEPSANTWENYALFVKHLAEKNPERKIYLPMGCQRDLFYALYDDLYMVGTVYQYCTKRIDNYALLKRNWDENIQLGYLDFMPYSDQYSYTPEKLPSTVLSYFYPIFNLYRHYKDAGEAQNAEDMLNLAKRLSAKVGKPDEYKRFLNAKAK